MNLNKQQFWMGVSILLNNYHAINRKLSACVITGVEKVHKYLHQKCDIGEKKDHIQDIDKTLFITQLLQISKDEINYENIEGFKVHFKCIPKNAADSFKAEGFIDFANCSFKMIFESDAMVDFNITLNGELTIEALHGTQHIDSHVRWCDYVLKPKFYKWCLNEEYKSNCNNNTSLRLVDVEKYNRLYNLLKEKYSSSVFKFWKDAKESTDPLKYIYEDLAISAYLITLWQSDLVKGAPTAFADLGCGNGLLVYILIQEGYQGYGYDVRSRKIWSLYPVEVHSNLFEKAVEPLKFNLPSEVDWLIGNHSDELSPWLPVLAATCHKNINFFLLPCCAYEFSGNKFQRRNSSISCYKDFCDYAEKISNMCGFKTKKDRLRIPSTKRNALIGFHHLNSDEQFLARMEAIKNFVKNEHWKHSNSSLEEIKLREKEEPVRNCTQIEKSSIETLVKEIFFLLLTKASNCNDTHINSANNWQIGSQLRISQLAKSLDKTKLKEIKAECGGLKTLLRNKHEIFQLEQDLVSIRKPQRNHSNTNSPKTVKKRACFFKLNHPQGCPLMDVECTFLH